jgi:hypothetical protein
MQRKTASRIANLAAEQLRAELWAHVEAGGTFDPKDYIELVVKDHYYLTYNRLVERSRQLRRKSAQSRVGAGCKSLPDAPRLLHA